MQKTGWKDDLFLQVEIVWQKLSTSYMDITHMTYMLPLSAHILESFRKLQWISKWENGNNVNPEDKTTYTTPYQKGFLQHVEKEYCTKVQPLPIITHGSTPWNNPFTPPMV
jgi:hypothetical protein